MRRMITVGDKPDSLMAATTCRGMPRTETDVEKITAPTMMNVSIPQTKVVDMRARYSPFQEKVPSHPEMIKVRNAATPPASVGVAMPK